MASYLSALGVLFQPMNFIMMYLCSLIGCVLGAIPGLSGGLGITLILPMTFALNTNLSFAMLLGMYVGGVSGSFIAAVLVGIPGSAASIGTCYDGYPMTQKGQAARALTIGITGSFIGTLVSIIVATLCSTFIADVALMLGPWEYFSLCLMAITMVVGLSNGSIFKGLLAAFFGLWLSTIGSDMVTNQLRFTFKNTNLYGGINVVCLLMGTFALQQVATSYAKNNLDMPEVDAGSLKGFGLSFKDFKANLKTIITSLFIGLWIGFLPGMGSGISNMVAYGYAKGISKDPESFGKGNPAGVWASETANNASLGGALIPMMALGIPGDGITAMLIAGLTIHGLQAGPLFMTEQPDLAMLIFACVMVSAIVTYLIQIVTKRWFPYILKIPYHYLYTVILVISFIGGYGISNTMFNIYVMLALCLLSLFMSVAGLPTSPLVLAFILSSKLERYFRQGISYAHGSYAPFFTRPISLILLIISVLCVFWPYISDHLKAKKAAKNPAPTAANVDVNDD